MPLLASLALALMTTVSRPGTDTTLTVRPGTRLGLDNFAGSVTVTTWSRNALRVHADHHRRTEIEIQTTPGRIELSASGYMGTPGFVDYTLTVPSWMAVEIEGVGTDVSVDGLKAELKAETTKGDVEVKNSSGTMSLSSVEGVVRLTDCSGHIQAETVNDDVTATRSHGELQLETVNGAVVMQDVDGSQIEASSVNGEIIFSGSYRDGSSYSFSTHNGDVLLGVPERSNLSVSVSTFNGGFNASFPVQVSERKKGREFRFTLGTGAAGLEVEAFGGEVRMVRPDAVLRALKEREVKAAAEHAHVHDGDEDDDHDSDSKEP